MKSKAKTREMEMMDALRYSLKHSPKDILVPPQVFQNEPEIIDKIVNARYIYFTLTERRDHCEIQRATALEAIKGIPNPAFNLPPMPRSIPLTHQRRINNWEKIMQIYENPDKFYLFRDPGGDIFEIIATEDFQKYVERSTAWLKELSPEEFELILADYYECNRLAIEEDKNG